MLIKNDFNIKTSETLLDIKNSESFAMRLAKTIAKEPSLSFAGLNMHQR